MRLAQRTEARRNPLDAAMTKTQVVRRKFKSALPRSPENRELSKLEAMARTMELFDRLRGMMAEAGLEVQNVSAGLVYYQPHTKGMERVLALTIPLPAPEKIGDFVKNVMALDKPHFLGVIFGQHDRDATQAKYRNTVFATPFMGGPDDQARLLAARNSAALGGSKKTAN